MLTSLSGFPTFSSSPFSTSPLLSTSPPSTFLPMSEHELGALADLQYSTKKVNRQQKQWSSMILPQKVFLIESLVLCQDLATPFLVNDILEPPQNSQYPASSRCKSLSSIATITSETKLPEITKTWPPCSPSFVGCNAQPHHHHHHRPCSTPPIEHHRQVP